MRVGVSASGDRFIAVSSQTNGAQCRRDTELANPSWTLKSERAKPWAAAAKAANPDVIVLCHGGPIATPDDAQHVLAHCPACHGFYGASSMERLPAEAAIARQTADFKAVTLHDQKKKKG